MLKTAIAFALVALPLTAAAQSSTTDPLLEGIRARRTARVAALAEAQHRRDLQLEMVALRAGQLVELALTTIPARPATPRLVNPTPRSPLDEATTAGGGWPRRTLSRQ